MAKILLKLIAFLLMLFAIIQFVSGYISNDFGLLCVSSFVAWSAALINSLGDKKVNRIYVLFLVSFFIFLLSRIMIRWINTREIYLPFDQDVMKTVYSLLFISTVGLFVGATIRVTPKRYNIIEAGISREHVDNKGLQMATGFLTMVCGVAQIVVNVEKYFFWARIGGAAGGALRISFVSSLPAVISRISYVYILMLCIYLATLPPKKNVCFVLGEYLLICAVKMMYGSRGDFILGLMFAFIYFTIRDNQSEKCDNKTVKWIGRTERLFIVISIPILIILIVFISYYRIGTSFQFTSFRDTLNDFFESQGTTVDVLGYTKKYENSFPMPKQLYLFDNTYSFLATNPLSSVLFGHHAYKVNTIERALYGTSLDQTIYYLINPASYLMGRGCGSSYVAEAWLGYGFIGVFLINVFLGVVINLLNDYSFNKIFNNTVAFAFLQSLYFVPRAGFDEFVGDILSVTHIISLAVVWVAYKMVMQLRRPIINE
ncbi:MAG: O-antigen polysaccharide polymerase Wzy family protein [Lachnospiraceae bacterium]|nr:O-antigen polysaccharide polymerase Wzy family protein [Lachnospiraceae bacterium]